MNYLSLRGVVASIRGFRHTVSFPLEILYHEVSSQVYKGSMEYKKSVKDLATCMFLSHKNTRPLPHANI